MVQHMVQEDRVKCIRISMSKMTHHFNWLTHHVLNDLYIIDQEEDKCRYNTCTCSYYVLYYLCMYVELHVHVELLSFYIPFFSPSSLSLSLFSSFQQIKIRRDREKREERKLGGRQQVTLKKNREK